MASGYSLHQEQHEWKTYELLLFRFLFIFIVIQIIPLDYKFYNYILSINWLHITYADIFGIGKYVPIVFQNRESYYDWFLFIGVAIAGSAIWSIKDKNVRQYNFLYYFLTGLSRYRLAAGILTYGFLKLFALMAPEPSLSTLNTHYGEFTDWKLFSITLGGAQPYYQTFLGFVEILSAILLLNRKTASIGALIAVSFLGNVFLSNLAYGGEEYVYSSYLIVLALFILSRDAVRLFKLLFLEIPATPNNYHPVFHSHQIYRLVRGTKYLFIFFFIALLGYKSYRGYVNDPYQVPANAGLNKSSGFYNVSLFVVNKDTIPYSTTDTTRWRDVVFEKWPTISIRRNRTTKVDQLRAEYFAVNNEDRIYESSETIGRQYYSYKADTSKNTLFLQDKNRHYQKQKLMLKYSRPDSATIVLDGIDENRNIIHVRLEKQNKIYLLQKGRSKDIKL